MTRNTSDLLVVYLFAREVGLMTPAGDGDGDACILPVVPLFETIEDLEKSPAILAGVPSPPRYPKKSRVPEKKSGQQKGSSRGHDRIQRQ